MPWTHFKRPGTRARIEPVAGQTEQDRVAEELMTLRQWRDQLLRPISVAGAFNLLDNSQSSSWPGSCGQVTTWHR